MAVTYQEPPKFMVEDLVAEADFVIALGKIEMKDSNGELARAGSHTKAR